MPSSPEMSMRDDEAGVRRASGQGLGRTPEPAHEAGRRDREPPVVSTIRNQRVLGIVRSASADTARDIAVALWEAGLRTVEISVSTPGAIDAVAALAHERSDPVLHVGAGTILDRVTARAAVEAGADLLVSPIADPLVIAVCRDARVPVLAGATTPMEAMTAMAAGASLVKLLPARSLTTGIIADILQARP